VDSLNRDARRNQVDLILTELDPFPGLHDGSGMHKDNAAPVPRPAEDFTTVAVEATVATYDLHPFKFSYRNLLSFSLFLLSWNQWVFRIYS
jgi:hypothetical protein